MTATDLCAIRQGQDHRGKTYISNAPDADVYTLFARTTVGAGARGVTTFVVTSHFEGLGGEPIEMISPHPLGRIHLDGV